MGAKYESPKPDGYLSTRNHVYLERERLQKERALREQAALRNFPSESLENYADKSYK